MQLNEIINLYTSLGFTVMPLRAGEKVPKAAGWLFKPAAELLADFAEGDNVGIRIEKPFFVVDVDDARLSRLIEDDFPQTLTTKTSRGYHFWFRALGDYPETNKKSRLVQLLATGCQVVAPPSRVDGHEYRFLDPNAQIASLNARALDKLQRIIEALGEYEEVIRNFAEAWSEGHRHNLSLWLNGVLRKAGVPRFEAAVVVKSICLLTGDGEIADRLRALEDTYRKPIEEIAAWSKLRDELKNIVGPEKAEVLLSLLPSNIDEKDEGKEKRPQASYVVGGEVIAGSLCEVVSTAEGPSILLYRDGKMSIVQEFEQDGILYKPYHVFPFFLPNAPEKIDNDPTLWRETRDFVKAYFDHFDPRVYDVMTAAVAWSYFYREVKASTPYILFLGPWRSGKTRALEVLEALFYRAIRVVDPSEAALFRSIAIFRPALLVDEAQIVDGNVRAVMASGYRYGAKVMRVVDPEADGFEGIRFFDTFAFIVYAAREEPPADIMSRSVVVRCERNMNPVAKRIDERRAAELRTRWLAQRLLHHGRISVTFEEFPSDDGRVQEMFSPLVVMAQVFGDSGAVEAVNSYGRDTESELRQLEASTQEAEVVEALLKHVESTPGDAPPIVQASDLQAILGEGWTPQKIGRRLTVLGFKRFRAAGGKKRGYAIDYGLLRRLAIRYGFEEYTLDDIYEGTKLK